MKDHITLNTEIAKAQTFAATQPSTKSYPEPREQVRAGRIRRKPSQENLDDNREA